MRLVSLLGNPASLNQGRVGGEKSVGSREGMVPLTLTASQAIFTHKHSSSYIFIVMKSCFGHGVKNRPKVFFIWVKFPL